MMHLSQKHGFTLIELLVVVAIISILASIALPNFQHAQVKAKVAAAYAEMQTLSTTIESYQLDHNTYPLDGNDYFEKKEDYFDQRFIQRVLTTPTAYITDLPDDLFHQKETHNMYDPVLRRHFQSKPPYPYIYMTEGNFMTHRGAPRAYYIFSLGPDKYFNNDSKLKDDFILYDPSNGVISDGDLLRKGP